MFTGNAGYPTYHTGYETFYLMKTHIGERIENLRYFLSSNYLSDPEFSLHKTCTQLGLDMILNLAESPVLPLSPKHISTEIHNGISSLLSSNITPKLAELDSTEAWKVMIIAGGSSS